MVIPSLLSICLIALSNYPQHVHLLSTRLHYSTNILSIIDLNPNLWLTIIQVFHELPSYFKKYSLPLHHQLIPISQSIQNTTDFTLLTLLDLQHCQHLTDTNITRLNILNNLTALNISHTEITPLAIKNLVNTLRVKDDAHPTGPWSLRIIALRNCHSISDSVYSELVNFPLLAVVDLRGTKCTPQPSFPFVSCTVDEYYHPANLQDSAEHLQASYPETFSSSNSYFLHISEWESKKCAKPLVASQNAFAVIPSNPQHNIVAGNSITLQMREQEREQLLQHERNKEAWYRRQDIFESKGLPTSLDPLSASFPRLDVVRHRVPAVPRLFGANRPSVGTNPRLSTSEHTRSILPKAHYNSSVVASQTIIESRSRTTPSLNTDNPSLTPRCSPSDTPSSRASTGSTREGTTRPSQRVGSSSLAIAAQQHPNTNTAVAETFYASNRIVRTDSKTPEITSQRVAKRREFESLSDAKTRHLKLFREPPPYSALQGAIRKVVTAQESFAQDTEEKRLHREGVKAGKEKAVFDLNGEKAMGIRKRMEASLMGMVASRMNGDAAGGNTERPVKRRRVSDQGMSPFDYGGQPLVANKKPNPFRRRSEVPSLGPTSDLSRPQEGVELDDDEIYDSIKNDDVNVRGGGSVWTKNKSSGDSSLLITPSKSSDKRLKPITSLPIPILTPEMQQEEWAKEAKALGITVDKLKRIGFGWTSDKNSSKTCENADDKRDSGASTSRSNINVTRQQSSSGREDKRRKNTGGSSSSSSSILTKNSKAKTGFDWSNWGKKDK